MVWCSNTFWETNVRHGPLLHRGRRLKMTGTHIDLRQFIQIITPIKLNNFKWIKWGVMQHRGHKPSLGEMRSFPGVIQLDWDLNNSLAGQRVRGTEVSYTGSSMTKDLTAGAKRKKTHVLKSSGAGADRCVSWGSRKQAMQELAENCELYSEFNAKSLRSFKQGNNVFWWQCWKIFVAPETTITSE